MDRKNKNISGLRDGNNNNNNDQKPKKYFTDLERHKIIQKFLGASTGSLL